jgi:hypothetical protein
MATRRTVRQIAEDNVKKAEGKLAAIDTRIKRVESELVAAKGARQRQLTEIDYLKQHPALRQLALDTEDETAST